MKDQAQRGIWAWDIVKYISITCLLLIIVDLIFNGFNEESTRLIIRGTARTAVFLFCLAFGASSIHLFFRNPFSFWISMNRKYWGISFAIIHLVHLSSLFVLQYFFHPVFERAATKSLMAGGLVYVFVVLMLLTSFDYFAKRISRSNWKVLHLMGGHWTWVIFMSTYSKKVMANSAFSPILGMLIIIMALRLWKLWKTKG